MKVTKKPIDLTEFGELQDVDGWMPLEDNLIGAFEYLLPKRFYKGKFFRSQKVKIFVSKVGDENTDNPYRYASKKIVTIGTLLDEWKLVFENEFSKESLQKAQRHQEFKRIHLERQAEGSAAWGMYSADVRFRNALKADQKFNNSIKGLGYKEQEEQRKKRREKQGANHLVIG